MREKLAVVLFNLGGPDRLEAVRPFLVNLFSDPAIIGAPAPVRWLLARLIAKRRTPVAKEIYRQMGGRSPLLELTREQASSLEQELVRRGREARVFVSMRYWHPLSDETAREVQAYGSDRIVLLPLYPQFSTTTTGSSFKEWSGAATDRGLGQDQRFVCCYPCEKGLVAAQSRLLRDALAKVDGAGKRRVLFSAHGLPKKVVRGGDPYQWQVEKTAAAVAAAIGFADLEWVICYQSRVGPLEWIGPSTEEEIERAGREGVAVVIVPIAFVSEHSETLVELDIEYATKARACGVPAYIRVPTVGTSSEFIAGLADTVEDALVRDPRVCRVGSTRICPRTFTRCPCPP